MSNPSLDELVAKYIAAVDSGEEPERERWMADHPNHADALREFFADFDRMRGTMELADPEPTGDFANDLNDVKNTTQSDSKHPSLEKLSDGTLHDLERLLERIKAHRVKPSSRETRADSGTASSTGTDDETRKDGPNPHQVIDDKYKLLKIVGEGGMGQVWMAEQEYPVRRRVAVKLIKKGINSKEIVARFEAERQALALMDHPNISRVLDGGKTYEGQPYFVMELVQGIPITKYCDQHKLSIEERLRLFVPVCNAVQHAHQKGIIHRDLKPSNILIHMSEGQPIAKIIDFGLAKALQHQARLTDKTLFTEFGQVLGTLLYMSPEQAEANELDIDTRSDIYSLGIVLYELLTGTTPVDKESLKEKAFHLILKDLIENEPKRPSERLSTRKEQLTVASNSRDISPKRLTQILHGELDWVVMKALERDRKRRYDTALEFGEDVKRFITGMPVNAKPPSNVYIFKKYALKHRGLVASIAAISLAILMGIAGSLYFAFQEQEARGQAELRGDRLKNSVNLLESVFADINPAGDELGDADLRQRLKDNLLSAVEQLQTAIVEGRSDTETDIPLLMQMVETLEGLGVAAWGRVEGIKPFVDESSESGREIALKLELQRAFAKGTSAVRSIVNRYHEEFGADDERTIDASIGLAWMLTQTNIPEDCRDAIKIYEGIVERSKTLGDNKRLGAALHGLSFGYLGINELDQSILLMEQAVVAFEEHVGEYHLNTLETKRTLADRYRRAGNREREAKALLEEVCEDFQQHHGRWNSATCLAFMDLMIVCATYNHIPEFVDRAKELLPSVEESYSHIRSNYGKDHPWAMTLLGNLATAYGITGDIEKCLEMHLALHERFVAMDGVDSKRVQEHNSVLSAVYQERGDYAKAAELMSKYVEFATKEYGLNDKRTSDAVWARNTLWVKSRFTQDNRSEQE